MEPYSEVYTFYVSTGYTDCQREEDIKIYFNGNETKEEKNRTVNEAYQEWLHDACACSWWKKE